MVPYLQPARQSGDAAPNQVHEYKCKEFVQDVLIAPGNKHLLGEWKLGRSVRKPDVDAVIAAEDEFVRRCLNRQPLPPLFGPDGAAAGGFVGGRIRRCGAALPSLWLKHCLS